MIKKRKKKWTFFLILKIFFISIGKLIYNIFNGIFKIFKSLVKLFNFSGKKIKDKAQESKLKKSRIYNQESIFENFEVIKEVKGDYYSTEKILYNDSIIALIFGKRGSGKSSLGFKLLENIHYKTKRKCYALDISQNMLPKWISSIDSIEKVPDGSVVLVDEGAVSFGARESMTLKNRDLIKILAIARHNNLTLIFVTQNTGLIDKNILALTDILLIKEGSLLQMEMERPEVKKFYEKSHEHFKKLGRNMKKYAYVIDSNFEGVISYDLPSFWSENLSKNKS